ncbi:hypothetical protein ACWNT8_15760 (plasmid) [Pigmentibacter ruber]
MQNSKSLSVAKLFVFFFSCFLILIMIGLCSSQNSKTEKKIVLTEEAITKKAKEISENKNLLKSSEDKRLHIPKKYAELAFRSAAIVALEHSCQEIYAIKKATDANGEPYDFGKKLEDSTLHIYCEPKDNQAAVHNSYYQTLSDTKINKYSNYAMLDESESFSSCMSAIKSRVKYKNSFDYKLMTVKQTLNHAYYYVTFDFTAKNAFNMEIESQAKCTIATLSPSSPAVTILSDS